MQSAADGLSGDLKADDDGIQQPQSVTKIACLDNFFGGVGLDILTKGIDAGSIAKAAAGKICSQLATAWNDLKGRAQCGLSVSGINTGFDLGLGGGSFCPTLSFGGGGDSLVTAGLNNSGTSTWDVQGSPQLPDGYSLPGGAP